MGEDVNCKLLCHEPSKLMMTWNEESSQRVIERIQHEYSVHLLEYFIMMCYEEVCLAHLYIYVNLFSD